MAIQRRTGLGKINAEIINGIRDNCQVQDNTLQGGFQTILEDIIFIEGDLRNTKVKILQANHNTYAYLKTADYWGLFKQKIKIHGRQINRYDSWSRFKQGLRSGLNDYVWQPICNTADWVRRQIEDNFGVIVQAVAGVVTARLALMPRR